MKCRYCAAQARVISTRTPDGEFYVVRRLACTAFPKSHRFNTVEVLESLIAKIPRKRIEEYLGHNRRGAQRNRTAHERYMAAVQLINAGEKYDVVAADLGVSLASVRKYASKGYRPGTLRHVAEDTGHESICSPGQPLYSTMNMIAQWFWDGNEEGGQWARIWPEE